MPKPRVVVVGGVVMDLRFDIAELPNVNGSTQGTFSEEAGGKGLNQAVACSRLGAQVSLISALGDDPHGRKLSEIVTSEHIRPLIKVVSEHDDIRTDVTGVIMSQGKPTYIGCRRATNFLGADFIQSHINEVHAAEIVLVTFDVSQEAVRAAIACAKSAQKRVIVNAAPSTNMELSVLNQVDYVVLTDIEATAWVNDQSRKVKGGRSKHDMTDAELGSFILRSGCKTVVITKQEKGCTVVDRRGVREYGVFDVSAIDETAASDAFCAGLAIAMAEKRAPRDQIRYASAAGACACIEIGAYSAMPYEDHFRRFLYERQHVALI